MGAQAGIEIVGGARHRDIERIVRQLTKAVEGISVHNADRGAPVLVGLS